MINKNKHHYLPRRILSALLVGVILFSTNFMVLEVSANEVTPNNVPIIVSLGDSYSSGEGIEPFYGQNESPELKVKNEDWLAHRSEKSWGGMLSLPNVSGTMADHRNENWFFAASSGATTKHINTKKQFKSYRYQTFNDGRKVNGYIGDTYLPLQLDVFDEINDSVGKNEVDYVTMSIGGNDAGFAKILEKAALSIGYLNPSELTDTINKSKEKVEKGEIIYNSLKKAYTDICDEAGKQAKVIVAGYPKLLDPNVSNVFFDSCEATIINDATTYFNDAIENLVETCRTEQDMNIHFVSVESTFENHGAYSDEPYINPVLVPQSEDLLGLGDVYTDENNKIKVCLTSAYSIHPNYNGACYYSACVQAKIHELEDKSINHLSGTTYSSNLNISVLNYNLEKCGSYKIIIEGVKTGLFGLNKEKYSDEITVSQTLPQQITLPDGTYTITVTDGTVSHYKEVEISSSGSNSDLKFYTIFGYKIPDETSVAPEGTTNQNSSENETKPQTNYDKYDKYIGKTKEFILEKFPSAKIDGGDLLCSIWISETVALCYVPYETPQVISSYHCFAQEIYPNINCEKNSITKSELENYLGITVNYWSKEQDPDGNAGINYNHNGYTIYVDCEDDGSIIFDKTVFYVRKQTEPYDPDYPRTPELNEDNFYEIYTAEQLIWFGDVVISGKQDINAILLADIDLNEGYKFNNDGTVEYNGKIVSEGWQEWRSIGVSNCEGAGGHLDTDMYNGTFDGNGYTIRGLYLSVSNSDYVGFFGCISESACVKNLTIKNSYLEGYHKVGGIVGLNYGLVDNCNNNATIRGYGHHGGIVGQNYGTIKNCKNYGFISSNFDVGGIVGINSGVIEDCSNSGPVYANHARIGGIAGRSFGFISNCSNSGDVTDNCNTSDSNGVGGILGVNEDDGEIRNCNNSGKISGSDCVGGICGYTHDNVYNCSNTGSVKGNSFVGGAFGFNEGKIINCTNSGAVDGNLYVGGFIAENSLRTEISDCSYLKSCADYGIADCRKHQMENCNMCDLEAYE